MWPMQRECDHYYGNPRGIGGNPSRGWESENLVMISAPYQMYYDGKPIRGIRVHRKCADAFRRVFIRIWEEAWRSQSVVDSWGASTFSGAYVYRNKRGGGTLSMHAYGCAIDLDAPRNPFHSTRGNFSREPAMAVVRAFEAEGAIWGGRWSGRSCDPQHFQFSRVNNVTVADLREAGSRVVNAADHIKTSVGSMGAGLATATAMASQVNDIHGQFTTIMSAVDNGQNIASTITDNWRLIVLVLSVALMAYAALRIWRSASLAQDARVDNARTGEPGDQVLRDNPEPGNVTDGIVF